ncbi:MAG: hypothetical protein NZ740_03250 [Kiritimatiellae bacterium]|nr:hypothetical protein [Kiritimatiellia bacterium]MDW8458109.1 hypothetical protein [Verrucomicrobiota bacterium]
MRKIIVILALALWAVAAPGQEREKVLIDEDDRWNLFTRFDVKHSDLGPGATWLGGVQVGGLLNDRIGVGVAGYANIEDFSEAPPGYNLPQTFDLAYAALLADYSFRFDQVFHLSVGAAVGIGRLEAEKTGGRAADELRFSLIEPQINAALHLTPTIDVGAGVGYRWFDFRQERGGWRNGDFEGFVATLFLRFTQF